MQEKVKINTGIMGATTKVVLMVAEIVEAKLKNNEEYIFIIKPLVCYSSMN